MITCLCGGNAYTRDELTEMKHPLEEDFGDYAGMWYALMGPNDYYCSDEDDVLTRAEIKKAKSLRFKTQRVVKNGTVNATNWLLDTELVPRILILVWLALIVTAPLMAVSV